MQAIARVNRVYKDKAGGLIVDYLGIASNLKKALSFYLDAGGKGNPATKLSLILATETVLKQAELIAEELVQDDK